MPRKSKSTKLCPLVGSGILNPWIILKTSHFVWSAGLPGYVYSTHKPPHISTNSNLTWKWSSGISAPRLICMLPALGWRLKIQWQRGIWVFPKIGVPQTIHLFIGFSIINHPFWGVLPLFLEAPIWLRTKFWTCRLWTTCSLCDLDMEICMKKWLTNSSPTSKQQHFFCL